ncbi:MAG: hypothetical protein H0U18_03235 [Pyrinomonadaceae bacterium]|nr:hypothetical protein [Pyrinomonadaceae bacterium]
MQVQLVSIDLIRRLARQMESGEIAPASFLELLPLGWYVPEFDVEVAGSDDTEHVHPMVLVYADEKEHYDAFLERVTKADLARFADPALQYEEVKTQMEGWRNKFFTDERMHTSGLGMNLFQLIRHLAQTGGQSPPFFPFEQRDEHDLQLNSFRSARRIPATSLFSTLTLGEPAERILLVWRLPLIRRCEGVAKAQYNALRD